LLSKQVISAEQSNLKLEASLDATGGSTAWWTAPCDHGDEKWYTENHDILTKQLIVYLLDVSTFIPIISENDISTFSIFCFTIHIFKRPSYM